ncbi:hypothetical protein N9901_00725 [Flavobacteriaceae bacterium]|nr:hypothetical protein [Flavobacteriaceae bacterium]
MHIFHISLLTFFLSNALSFSQDISWVDSANIETPSGWTNFKNNENFTLVTTESTPEIKSLLNYEYPSAVNIKKANDVTDIISAFYVYKNNNEENELFILTQINNVWENLNANLSSEHYLDFDDFKVTNTKNYIAVLFEENPKGNITNYQLKVYNKNNQTWTNYGKILDHDDLEKNEYINGYSFDLQDNVYLERTIPNYRITQLTSNIEDLIAITLSNTVIELEGNNLTFSHETKTFYHSNQTSLEIKNAYGQKIINNNIERGFYIVRILNKSNNKYYTQKFIVE